MAHIAFIQNKLGKTDGVSLEVDKWRDVLEEMGHTVFYFAGNDDVPGIHTIKELSLFHPLINKLLRNGTVERTDYPDEKPLLDEIHSAARIIKKRLKELIGRYNIDLIIPNNLQSVGYNIPAMKAIYELIEETGIPAVAHSHDFWWEDSGEVDPTGPGIRKFYEQYAPPALPGVQHAVINRIAHQALRERKGIDAEIVPNVFDFSQSPWKLDDYNRNFRREIGAAPEDIILLQATRVLDRKGIELAVDLAGILNTAPFRSQLESGRLYDGRSFSSSGRIILVCAGYVEQFGITGNYLAALKERARERNAELIFTGDRVRHTRDNSGGTKIYSLWDSYVHADLVTYPSWWEGWGNQFIEAVFARQPVYLFEYPVYLTDLKPAGFDVISLGSELGPKDRHGLVTLPEEILIRAARETLAYLIDPVRRKKSCDWNFRIAEERFSTRKLKEQVARLIEPLLR
jgi:glycosyltransferase involved in cell wall biosynthesis